MAEALAPLSSVAMISWSPAVTFAGMVVEIVNEPLALVFMVEFVSSELPSIARVTFWPLPKLEPTISSSPPLLTDVCVRTMDAIPIPGVDAVTLPGMAAVSLPGGAGRVSLSDGGACCNAVVLPAVELPPIPCTVNVAVAFSPALLAAFISWSPSVALAGMSAVMENSPVANCIMLPVRMYLSSNVNLNVCPGENPVPSMVTLVPVPPDAGFKVIDSAKVVSLPAGAAAEVPFDDCDVSLPEGGMEEVSLLPGVVVVFPGGICAAALLAVNPGATATPRIARPTATASTMYRVVSNILYQHEFLYLRQLRYSVDRCFHPPNFAIYA